MPKGDEFIGLTSTAWTGLYTILTLGILIVGVVAPFVAWRTLKESYRPIVSARVEQLRGRPQSRFALEHCQHCCPWSTSKNKAMESSWSDVVILRNDGNRSAFHVRIVSVEWIHPSQDEMEHTLQIAGVASAPEGVFIPPGSEFETPPFDTTRVLPDPKRSDCKWSSDFDHSLKVEIEYRRYPGARKRYTETVFTDINVGRST